jgi:cyclohexadieny/prephenate dehydrogenase
MHVLGYDRDPVSVAGALADGVIAKALDPTLDGIEEADLVVFALPVGAAVELVAHVAPRVGRALLITDLGSTKRSIVAACEAAGIGGIFVGGHPLTGDHRSGWNASRTGLFARSTVFLCPAPSTRPAALALAEAFWRRLGAHTECVDAAVHDVMVTWRSHLPQLAATSLALALQHAGITRAELGPGGRDATRIAGSDADMWVAIARDNADNIAPALAAFETQVRMLRSALERDDDIMLRRMLYATQSWSNGDSLPG